MSNPVRVGILGTGRIAVDAHIHAIREAGGIVAALADIAPGRAQRFARSLGVPLSFESSADMIQSGAIDAMDICTPPASHCAEVMAALAAGLPVYLEKPPAMNQAEMRRMADASRAAGIPLVTGTNHVFHPAVQLVRGLIDRGEMGEIYVVECHKTIRRFYRKGWHRSRSIAGGGVVMDSSTHRLDIALYLLSNPAIRAVTARTFSHFAGLEEPAVSRQSYLVMDVAEQKQADGSGTPAALAAPAVPVDVEDSAVAMFRLETGAVLSLREMVSVNMPDETVIRLYGTRSGAVMRFAGPNAGSVSVYSQLPDGTLVDLAPVLPDASRAESSHTGAFRRFFQCVRDGADFLPGLDRAVNLMGMVDAIYSSAAREGAEVVFP
jgi:predicted dehydrogenase